MSVCAREVKTSFFTVISRDGHDGEIDPNFAKLYANELKPLLKICDAITGVEHMVSYNMNTEMPRFTSGWTELWNYYKLTEEHHPVMLIYFGGIEFRIHPTVHPKLYGSEIPKYHTLYGIHDDSIEFDIVVPNLETGNIKVQVDSKFMESIWKYGHAHLQVVGPTGKAIKCIVGWAERYFMYIEKSWKSFFKENGFNPGDILRLYPKGLKTSNLVRVEKKLREECMFGDDSDFIIHPELPNWIRMEEN